MQITVTSITQGTVTLKIYPVERTRIGTDGTVYFDIDHNLRIYQYMDVYTEDKTGRCFYPVVNRATGILYGFIDAIVGVEKIVLASSRDIRE